ncbi:MAG: PAS domain-containing protein [Betaproteobacteria bacterium]|nr:PAS domain-containing protein [Betaproteobacteria bacterium]
MNKGHQTILASLSSILDAINSGVDPKTVTDSFSLSSNEGRVMALVHEIISKISGLNQYQLTKLSLVMQASKVGLWDMQVVKGDPVNPNNTFTWSDEFRNMLGYSNESDFPNILSSWSDKLHPEDKEKTLNAFAKHLLDKTGKTPYNIEYRLLKKNGEYSYFHAFGATIRDEQGYAIRVAGAIQDITETKQVAFEKETALSRLNLLQKSIDIALWDMVVDPKDPVSGKNEFWWSTEFRNLLGFSNEREFPNVLSSWSDRLHPEDKDRTLAAFSAHLMDRTGKTPYNIEYRVKHKTGHYLWLRADGATLRDNNGMPLRVVGSVEDISKRLNKSKLDSHIEKFSQGIKNMAQRIETMLGATNGMTKAQVANLSISMESEKNAAETASIISAIQKVAGQSNILSLNASIEAARAGDAGRGFAVVADEVRKMSSETDELASQIERKLKSLHTSARQITEAIQETTTLSNEQNDAIIKLKEELNGVNDMYKELIAMTTTIV